MSLRLKFNLILITISVLGFAVAGFVAYQLQHKNARTEALETAAVLMESAMAIRSYTVEEIRPLISKQEVDTFLPQTVPAFAAAKYVDALQKKHPNYAYKEAALNPTNLSNKATDWEADIIQYFRKQQVDEFIGERDTPMGKSLFLSRPIKITNPGCLVCHSTPDQAPASLIKRYGSTNGFGWQLNEVIGAQIVSVPLDLAQARAQQEFITFMAALLGIFTVIGLALNILLHKFVIKPVSLMATNADKVSTGTLDLPELELKGKDEISSLGRSFNRMQRSLKNAMSLLDDDD